MEKKTKRYKGERTEEMCFMGRRMIVGWDRQPTDRQTAVRKRALCLSLSSTCFLSDKEKAICPKERGVWPCVCKQVHQIRHKIHDHWIRTKKENKARDCRKVKMRLHEEVEKKDTGIFLLVSMNRYIHTLWSVCHCHCHSPFPRSLSLTSIDRDGRIILLLTLTESNGIKAL